MTDNYIQHHTGGGTSLVGKDAVALMRAATLASGLRLYARTGMKLTRGASPLKMLAMAKGITGKGYKRGEYLEAAQDLQTWIDTMRCAIPHLVEQQRQR